MQTYGGGKLAIRPSEPGYADYLFWFHFANGSLMPAAMIGMVANLTGGDPSRLALLGARLERAYDQMETRLGMVPSFGGDMFTAADIIMVFPLTTMRLFAPRDLTPYPNIRAYLQRIGARAAFRRAMERCDPGLQVPLD